MGLSLALVFTVGGLAQVPLRSPKVNKRVLLNGLPIQAAELRPAPTVAVHLLIKSGAAFDPINKGGLADMTAEMLKAGTQQRSRQQIADELAAQGITVRTQVDWDATYITSQGPAPQAGRILDLIADLVIHPAFPEGEFNSFKTLRLATLKQQREDPGVLADQVFTQKLFERTTYARPSPGTPPSVANISLGDIKEFHRKFYLPNNALLVVIGDVDTANLLRLAGRKFGGWVKGDVPPFTFLRPQSPGASKIYLVDKPDLSQAQVRVGHLGIARDNDDYFPVRLLVQVLSGRVRSQRTPPMEVQFEPRRMAGPLVIRFSTPPEKVPALISGAVAAMKQMKDLITSKDLDEAKGALVAEYAAQAQTADQIAARWLEIDLYQLGSNYIDAYQTRVQRVTSEEMRRVAERYFDPGGQVIVVVGNAAALKRPLQALGPVTILANSAID